MRILAVFTLFLFCPSVVLAAQVVGLAQHVSGDVKIKQAGAGDAVALAQGADIALGDTVLTSEGGFVTIRFLDESTMSLNGADGVLSVDEYVFDPKNHAESHAKFTVLKASFEFIGGLMDKGEAEKVQIGMDFGSIGVRGTKILRSMRDDQCWIFLEEGNIRVFNDQGEVFLAAGEGTHIMTADAAPMPAEPWSQKDIDWVKKSVALPAAQ